MQDTAIRPHLGLSVRNLPASVDFYRRLFGVEPSKQRPDYAKFELTTPALNLTLNELPNLTQTLGAATHFGIEMASSEAVTAAMTRSRAAGVEVEAEMDSTCCYAVQDKFWATDPDGHRWEHFTVTDPDAAVHSTPREAVDPGTTESTQSTASACCEPSCCGGARAPQ